MIETVNKPMISVMIPTRNSLDNLQQCISSLVKFCTQMDKVEYIVKVDNDTNDAKFIKKIFRKIPSGEHCIYKIINSSRREGYVSIPEYFEEMINISEGKILWPFSDALIVAKGDWVSRLLSLDVSSKDGIYIAYFKYSSTKHKYAVGKYIQIGAAPAFSKKIYDSLGYLSLRGVQVDIFLRNIFKFMQEKVQLFEDVWVVHMHNSIGRGGNIDYVKKSISWAEYRILSEKILKGT